MSAVTQAPLATAVQDALPLLPLPRQWYVVHTLAHHEKRVAQQMQARQIEHFLPLYRTVRRWSDRKKELHLPLFPGYLFVHTALQERAGILQLPGVARLVSFHGQPAAVPPSEIEALRGTLRGNVCVEPYPCLSLGRRVRVHSGPLAGVEGFLVSKKGRLRVVLSIDVILRSIAVEVSAQEIEPVPAGGRVPACSAA